MPRHEPIGVVLLDPSDVASAAFAHPEYRCVVMRSTDGKRFCSLEAWADAVVDALGASAKSVVVIALSGAAYDEPLPAMRIADALGHTSIVLIEPGQGRFAETAAPGGDLDVIALEERVGVVLHCAEMPPYASWDSLALALAMPGILRRFLYTANRYGRGDNTCHAVAVEYEAAALNRSQAALAMLAMGLESMLVDLPAIADATPALAVGLAFCGAAVSEPREWHSDALDAGQLWRTFGARAAPLFPGCPGLSAPAPAVESAAPEPTRDEAFVTCGATELSNAVVTVFENIVERAQRTSSEPGAAAQDLELRRWFSDRNALDLDVTKLPQSSHCGLTVMTALDPEVCGALVHDLALKPRGAGRRTAASTGRLLLRVGSDSTDIAGSLLVNSAGIDAARLNRGELGPHEWTRITQAAGRLVDQNLWLGTLCRHAREVAACVRDAIGAQREEVVIDATARGHHLVLTDLALTLNMIAHDAPHAQILLVVDPRGVDWLIDSIPLEPLWTVDPVRAFRAVI